MATTFRITARRTQLRRPRPGAVGEAAKSYGVARSWICTLLDRYEAEGEAAFEPRSRRPKASPSASCAESWRTVLLTRCNAALTSFLN